jgi:hypothetical protein
LTQGNDGTHTTPITRVKVNTGKWTLGVRLAPTSSDTTKYQFHLQEAIKLCSHLLWAPLNRESTRTGFTTMILQKFGYLLGTTCVTKKSATVFKQNLCQQYYQKWASTGPRQQKYDQDRPSMPVCLCRNSGQYKEPVRISYWSGTYEKQMLLVTIFGLN